MINMDDLLFFTPSLHCLLPMPSRRPSPPPRAARPEGFSGQHLVVLPAPIRAASQAHALLRNLLVTDAGYFPTASGHRVERARGSATHLVIFCLRGAGWARSGDRSAAIAPGDALWLPADTPHAYGADGDDPWTIVWVHFQGSEVAGWREELAWANRMPFGLRHFSPDLLGSLGLDRIYARLERGYGTPDLLSAGVQLRSVLSALLDAGLSAGAAHSAAERTAAVRDSLAGDPLRSVRLEELATRAGLSVPHFCALFRRLSGYAPIDFLIRQRIRLACRLLDSGDAPIAEVATRSGFDDPYYFSRCFRRVMGASPRDYRRAVKG